MAEGEKEGGLSPLAKLTAGKRPGKVIDFPGRPGVQVGIQVPVEFDYDEARLGAWKHLKGNGVDPDSSRAAEMYRKELFARALASSLYTAESHENKIRVPLCSGVQDLKRHITPDEQKVLLRELADFTNEMDPDLDSVKGQQAAAKLLEEVLKKAGKRAALVPLLNGMPPSVVRRCLISLVEQHASLLEERSSSS